MEYHENAIEWLTGTDEIMLTLHQPRLVNKVRKLREKFPDMVEIIAENKDGSIYAKMPLKALKLQILVAPDGAAERARNLRRAGRKSSEKQAERK